MSAAVQLSVTGEPVSTRRPRVQRWRPKDRCYVTVSEIRDMLGLEATPAGYRVAERMMKRAGIWLKIGGRAMVARDSLGATFPDLALRFAMRDAVEVSRDLTW